ncbi:MAG: hypothetical protein WB992_24525, partial [Bryobacteraceae bacterium]
MITRDAWAVYSKAFAVCVAVYLLDQALVLLLKPAIHDQISRWAIGFAIFDIIAIIALSLYLLVVRAYTRLKRSLHDQIRPAIRDRVLALAFEGESWSSGVPKSGLDRQVLEESIAHALVTLKASGRERVAQFALDHGFATEWVKAFSSGSRERRKRAISLLALISPAAGNTVLPIALRDKHVAVRIEASRALLISGDQLEAANVFRS